MLVCFKKVKYSEKKNEAERIIIRGNHQKKDEIKTEFEPENNKLTLNKELS